MEFRLTQHNLSLEREKHTIRSINDLIEEDIVDDERSKQIEIREMELDIEPALLSKRDRDSAFLAELMERGETKASEFWV